MATKKTAPSRKGSKKKFSEPFSVDSALLQELGERLVTTPHVALAELVKNSYDADATEVRVTIRHGENGGPEITIEDDGVGMTTEQIRDFWMKIGTTHKATEEYSAIFGRPLTGSKGIGRFCVRRLGATAQVESTAKVPEGYEYTNLTIDWSRFQPGGEVTKINVPGYSKTVHSGKTGVTIIMSGLDEIEWHTLADQRSYGYLKRRLATLTANRGTKRRGYKADPGFRVVLDAPALDGSGEDPDDDGAAVDIRSELMNAGWALLKAKVDSKGIMTCRLEADQPVGIKTFERKKKFSSLKDVSLEAALFVEGPDWNRDPSLVPPGQLRSLLSKWGGIQLRYRGVRIFPYGDEGDDWLDIEKDRGRRLAKPPQDELFNLAQTLKGKVQIEPARVMLNLLSGQNYLGGVTVGVRQRGLEPKVDRMGFVNNRTFKELKTFARFAVDWSVVWRTYALAERTRLEAEKQRTKLEKSTGRDIPKAKKGEEALKILKQGVSKIQEAKRSQTLPDFSKEEIENLSTASSLLEAEFKTSKSDLKRFQLVASAATLTLLYHHETRFLTHSLRTLSLSLKSAERSLTDAGRERVRKVQESLKKSLQNLESLRQLTDEMGVMDQRAKSARLDLGVHCSSAVERFERVAELYKINISREIPEGLQVGPMLKGELVAVLLNVISNGLKAVIAGGSSRPAIEISASRAGRKIFLDVLDNGIGVRDEDRKAVFAPLVSDPSVTMYDSLEEKVTPEDRTLLGQGSGLGLSIVRSIIENRGGSAEFRDPPEGWNTCLRLEFPVQK